MRGDDNQQDTLISTVITEQRIPVDHPLCPIPEMVSATLQEPDENFNALYPDPVLVPSVGRVCTIRYLSLKESQAGS